MRDFGVRELAPAFSIADLAAVSYSPRRVAASKSGDESPHSKTPVPGARFVFIVKLHSVDRQYGGVWAARLAMIGPPRSARFFLISKLDPADSRFGEVCHVGGGRWRGLRRARRGEAFSVPSPIPPAPRIFRC